MYVYIYIYIYIYTYTFDSAVLVPTVPFLSSYQATGAHSIWCVLPVSLQSKLYVAFLGYGVRVVWKLFIFVMSSWVPPPKKN